MTTIGYETSSPTKKMRTSILLGSRQAAAEQVPRRARLASSATHSVGMGPSVG